MANATLKDRDLHSESAEILRAAAGRRSYIRSGWLACKSILRRNTIGPIRPGSTASPLAKKGLLLVDGKVGGRR